MSSALISGQPTLASGCTGMARYEEDEAGRKLLSLGLASHCPASYRLAAAGSEAHLDSDDMVMDALCMPSKFSLPD